MSKILGWFPVSKRPQTLIVRSPLFRYAEHYYGDPMGSARCDGIGCALCEVSSPRSISCCAVSKFGSDRIYLLKLTDKMQELADLLQEKGPQLIGTLIDASRDKKGDYYLTEINIVGKDQTTQVFCQAYVSAIGRKSYEFRTAMLRDPRALALELPA